MSEIVVGTDGSAASRSALRWSLEQGARTGSQVTVLYVWRVPLTVEVPFDPETISSMSEDLSPTAPASLPRTTAASLPGDPGPVLVNRARRADLLVVGARHRVDLGGSVSSYCLNHSRTPVVVVPVDSSTRPRHQTRRVTVGVALTPDSAAALKWASQEARSRDAELNVAYAWQFTPGVITHLNHHADIRRAQETHAVEALEDWVGEVLGAEREPTPSLHAEHGGPLDVLLSQAADADLLVVGSRGHHALARLLGGSTSGQLALQSRCPVVMVPSRNARFDPAI